MEAASERFWPKPKKRECFNVGFIVARKANQQDSAIHWRDLPHAEWDLEILKCVQFRAASDAFSDANRLQMEGVLPTNREIHGTYARHLAGEITFELRVCRDVYRKGLDAINRDSKTNRHRYTVEWAVARRAVPLLRRAFQVYFLQSHITFHTVQMLFDRHYPGGPLPYTEFQRQPAKDFPELLERIVPDNAFQRLDQDNELPCGNPFDLGAVIHGRSGIAYYQEFIPRIVKLYSSKRWWIKNIEFLWDAVLHEVVRQHTEVDLEIYGRRLEPPERRNLNKVLELYQELRNQNGRIGMDDLQKIAETADGLGMQPEELLGPSGRECLTFVRQTKHKRIETVCDLAQQVKKSQGCARSLHGFLTKFLSDALRDLHVRRSRT